MRLGSASLINRPHRAGVHTHRTTKPLLFHQILAAPSGAERVTLFRDYNF